jgi:hypothetical protein
MGKVASSSDPWVVELGAVPREPPVPWAPPRSLRWFASGEHCRDAEPGDLVLVAHAGDAAAAIRFGERVDVWRLGGLSPRAAARRAELRRYVWCNHAGIVVEDGLLFEQTGRGNRIVPLASYAPQMYCVAHLEISDAQREAVVLLARSCEGIRYGWVSIAGVVFDLVTGLRIAVGSGSRMTCSTLTSYCLVAGGLRPDKLLDAVLPTDLARYFAAVPPGRDRDDEGTR